MAADGEPNGASRGTLPEGIFSLLDTDLYKLTMQCGVLKYFPDVEVSYTYHNRTPNKSLTRRAVRWLQEQITKLGNIRVSDEELQYLRKTCSYLHDPYLRYLSEFHLRPSEQVKLSFEPIKDTGSDDDEGDLYIDTKGLWVETILYEIPLLALTSEAYFKFCDRDWTYVGQEERSYEKGVALIESGCSFSEFGSRRRRDYHTQDIVIQGLNRAAEEGMRKGWKGKLSGTSNVHFAMKHGIPPVGTVAHEWFMAIGAITNDYEHVNEIALRYWIGTFGKGILGIALTDTFGTSTFLEGFKQPVPKYTSAPPGGATIMASAASSTVPAAESLSGTNPPIEAPPPNGVDGTENREPTYAEVFTGVRQDSGDPSGFIKVMREFYDSQNIKERKTIVFSDSLNVERCIEYRKEAEEAGFYPVFGVGTFLTNDFVRASDGEKSPPLNIVVKISSAAGRPAIKISDNIGKNTGDKETVDWVKRRLGYVEHQWEDGDESNRWGKDDGAPGQ
ncbi:MAG: hypothetical protein M1819_004710 [Sarea resinae]|nr:MAG: hypothetical protein M1819_004710 [Sarea resinae]